MGVVSSFMTLRAAVRMDVSRVEERDSREPAAAASSARVDGGTRCRVFVLGIDIGDRAEHRGQMRGTGEQFAVEFRRERRCRDDQHRDQSRVRLDSFDDDALDCHPGVAKRTGKCGPAVSRDGKSSTQQPQRRRRDRLSSGRDRSGWHAVPVLRRSLDRASAERWRIGDRDAGRDGWLRVDCRESRCLDRRGARRNRKRKW